jgi:hypothetical protein
MNKFNFFENPKPVKLHDNQEYLIFLGNYIPDSYFIGFIEKIGDFIIYNYKTKHIINVSDKIDFNSILEGNFINNMYILDREKINIFYVLQNKEESKFYFYIINELKQLINN